MLLNLLGTSPDWAVATVRITLGIVFFAHGAQKMLGWFGGQGFTATMQSLTGQLKLPAPLAFLVIAAEFFGGIGLITGLLSRVAAIGIFANMAGAVAMVHFQYGLFTNWYGNRKGNGIEFHVLAMALALIVMVKGAGAFSLDQLWQGRQLGRETPVSQTSRTPAPRERILIAKPPERKRRKAPDIPLLLSARKPPQCSLPDDRRTMSQEWEA